MILVLKKLLKLKEILLLEGCVVAPINKCKNIFQNINCLENILDKKKMETVL